MGIIISQYYTVLEDNNAHNSDVLLKQKILNGENHYSLVSACLEILSMEC